MRLKTWLRIGGFFFLALFLGGTSGGGCGGKNQFSGDANQSSNQAVIESARIAIDEQAYTTAINILTGVCGSNPAAPACDSDTVSLLASAYMGRAGFDALVVAQNAQNTGAWPCPYTVFSKLFFQPFAMLSADQSDLNTSLALLNSITNRTADEGNQLMNAALSEMVVELGLVSGGYTAAGLPVTVPPSAAAIPAATVNAVNTDLGYIQTGLTESGLENEPVGQIITQVLQNLSPADANSLFAFLQILGGATC